MRDTHKTSGQICFFCPIAWAAISARLRLSQRESQILRRFLLDDDDAKAAAFLGISLATVKTHDRRLHEKLGVKTRVGMILRLCVADLRGSVKPLPHRGVG